MASERASAGTDGTSERASEAVPPDTHGAILQRARYLFARQGYRGTSIRQLTSGLGLTPAALYYHFTGKEEVLAEVLDPMESDGETIIAWMAELEPTPEALREVLDRYFDLLARHIVAFRFVAGDVDVQHSAVGQRLRAQARDLFAWLTGSSPEVGDRIRAAAAVGTIRLSLEQSGVDPDTHRDAIIGRALRIMTD
ncbi:TetR/AcrR family transcriptional regulator [Candidatus Poriferisodalis sp.]|uniref:TetR/AcrR family transcriptional regulator n=1 Tax=Candidatus Poriferisodalis sp. TaxID=3101277 RepID=UPI003B526320